jgi:hypothetical protein
VLDPSGLVICLSGVLWRSSLRPYYWSLDRGCCCCVGGETERMMSDGDEVDVDGCWIRCVGQMGQVLLHAVRGHPFWLGLS